MRLLLTLFLIGNLFLLNGMQKLSTVPRLEILASQAVGALVSLDDLLKSCSDNPDDIDRMELYTTLSLLRKGEELRSGQKSDSPKELNFLMKKYPDIISLIKQGFIRQFHTALPYLELLPEHENEAPLFNQELRAHVFALQENYAAFYTPKTHLLTVWQQLAASNYRCERAYSLEKPISTLCIDALSQTLAFDDQSDAVRVVSFKHNKPIAKSKLVDEKPITSLSLSHGGDLLAIGCSDGSLCITKVIPKGALSTALPSDIARCFCEGAVFFEKIHTGPVYSLAFDRTNRLLVSGSGDSRVVVWDIKECKPMSSWYSDEPVLCVSFDVTGKFVAFGNRTIKLKDWVDCTDVVSLSGGFDRPYSIWFSKDNKIKALYGDGSVRSWNDVQNYRCLSIDIKQFFYIQVIELLDKRSNSDPKELKEYVKKLQTRLERYSLEKPVLEYLDKKLHKVLLECAKREKELAVQAAHEEKINYLDCWEGLSDESIDQIVTVFGCLAHVSDDQLDFIASIYKKIEPKTKSIESIKQCITQLKELLKALEFQTLGEQSTYFKHKIENALLKHERTCILLWLTGEMTVFVEDEFGVERLVDELSLQQRQFVLEVVYYLADLLEHTKADFCVVEGKQAFQEHFQRNIQNLLDNRVLSSINKHIQMPLKRALESALGKLNLNYGVTTPNVQELNKA